jgi:uncharacterized protein (DUF924 family)
LSRIASPNELLDFWFGTADPAAAVPPNFARWFAGGPDLDQLVRERFSDTLEAARLGLLGRWLASPAGLLALVVLVDQLPRNAHRGTALAFAWNPLGLSAALYALEAGEDRKMGTFQRSFLYLPLEHTEDPAIQDRAVAEYEALLLAASPAERPVIENMLHHAHQHREVIRRFGRFPTRNEPLGREISAEEAAWLASPARYP